jgi:hypothetical protein
VDLIIHLRIYSPQTFVQPNVPVRLSELEEVHSSLESKFGEVLAALGAGGNRLSEIKGVVLDLTEQVSAIEHKIDGGKTP